MCHILPECGGAEYAKNNGIPVILFPKAKDEPKRLSPSDLVDTLRSDASLIGFLQLYLTFRLQGLYCFNESDVRILCKAETQIKKPV